MLPPRRPLLAILFLSVLFVFVAGCDQGPTGPPGPPGPPGISYVRSFTVDFLVGEAIVNGTVVSTAYDAPEITPDVVRDGVVMAYFREQDTWTAMPYTYGVGDPDEPSVEYTVTLGYAYEEAFIEVFYEVSDPNAIPTLPDQAIKVVVMDGGTARAADVDWSNYEAVQSHFDLPE